MKGLSLAALGAALGSALHMGTKGYTDLELVARKRYTGGEGRNKHPHKPSGVAKSRRAARKRKAGR
jgi:hypothetical protein